jgi:hypothetical protein
MRNLIISIMLSLFLLFPMTINADMILNGSSTTSTTDFNVSKNVTITYAVPTGNVGFTAISNHLQGDALYGAGSDTTGLFRNTTDKIKGTLNETLPTAANATAAFGDGTVAGAVGNWLPM